MVDISDTCPSKAAYVVYLLLPWHFSLKENNNSGFSALYICCMLLYESTLKKPLQESQPWLPRLTQLPILSHSLIHDHNVHFQPRRKIQMYKISSKLPFNSRIFIHCFSVKMATVSNPGPVYFWRETDPATGYLSQWYYCPFRDDEDEKKTYKTAEQ